MKTPELSSGLKRYEGPPKVIVSAPAVETLLAKDRSNSPWPEEIKKNPELEAQAKERRELLSALDTAFDAWPLQSDVRQAVESGRLSTEKAAEIYEKLTDFITEEKANARIMLYLPFEAIPPKDWRPESEVLADSIEGFRKIYLSKWNELLKEEDSRKNFHDGDTTRREDETWDFPRVVKAAHFIPNLIEKGYMDFAKARKMLEDSTDSVLRQSIADTFSYMNEKGLISEADLKSMEESEDSLVRNMSKILIAEKAEDSSIVEIPESVDKDWLMNLEEATPEDVSGVDGLRAKWEERRAMQGATEKNSVKISVALENGSISEKDIEEALSGSPDVFRIISIIRGLRERIEKAPSEYGKFAPTLIRLWETGVPEVCDELESLWSRLVNAGIIDRSRIESRGINIGTFENDFSPTTSLAKEDIGSVGKASSGIESNEGFKEFLYPASIVYGSKIKGYAERGADKDIAVFVKPGHDLKERAKIQEMIKETYGAAAMEFWLEEKSGGLRVKDFSEPDNQMGDSTLTPVLFEGVWAGNDGAIRELHEKLLAVYMKDDNETKREVWLGQMERDTLQYRLMHRGYNRFYPEVRPETKHGNDMDMDSAFWDPGYRRLATKLFVKKVFLPKLEK